MNAVLIGVGLALVAIVIWLMFRPKPPPGYIPQVSVPDNETPFAGSSVQWTVSGTAGSISDTMNARVDASGNWGTGLLTSVPMGPGETQACFTTVLLPKATGKACVEFWSTSHPEIIVLGCVTVKAEAAEFSSVETVV
jgi:hypothetical protein